MLQTCRARQVLPVTYGSVVYFWSDDLAEAPGSRAVRWGFTSRRGGVSGPPYDELNLGGAVGDDPEAVRTNRALVAKSVGVSPDRLVFMNQCHGSDVIVVGDQPDDGEAPSADGMVTRSDQLALAVLVADCVPVLLADAAAGVVGAVHAGRPGMTSGVVERAVEAMRELGARRVAAVVGPSVCGRCYEVPEPLRAAASEASAVSATVSWTGTPAVDVAAGVVEQLRRQDVEVRWVPGCSREDPRLFSYREAHRTGRFAGVVRLMPGEER